MVRDVSELITPRHWKRITSLSRTTQQGKGQWPYTKSSTDQRKEDSFAPLPLRLMECGPTTPRNVVAPKLLKRSTSGLTRSAAAKGGRVHIPEGSHGVNLNNSIPSEEPAVHSAQTSIHVCPIASSFITLADLVLDTPCPP